MSPQEQLNMMCKQLEMIQKQLADLRKMVSSKNGGAPKVDVQAGGCRCEGCQFCPTF